MTSCVSDCAHLSLFPFTHGSVFRSVPLQIYICICAMSFPVSLFLSMCLRLCLYLCVCAVCDAFLCVWLSPPVPVPVPVFVHVPVHVYLVHKLYLCLRQYLCVSARAPTCVSRALGCSVPLSVSVCVCLCICVGHDFLASCVCFCVPVLVAQVCVNITANEMENAWRYEYLKKFQGDTCACLLFPGPLTRFLCDCGD